MRYVEGTPPFWEVERGGGPTTDALQREKVLRELRYVDREIRYLEKVVNDLPKYVRKDCRSRTELKAFYARRRALLAQLGRERFAPVGLYDYDDEETGFSRPQNPERDSSACSYPYGNQHAAVVAFGFDGEGNTRVPRAKGCP